MFASFNRPGWRGGAVNMGNTMRASIRAIFAPALICISAPGVTHDPIDTTAYPELAPRAMLPAVVSNLKHTFKDPHSIQDFSICRPYKLGLRDGHPHTWATMLSFNAKNGNDGYGGIKMYAVAFKDGKVSGDIDPAEMGSNVGFDRLINQAIAKDMRDCEAVPDSEFQQMLQAAP